MICLTRESKWRLRQLICPRVLVLLAGLCMVNSFSVWFKAHHVIGCCTFENVGVVTDWSMNFRLTNAVQAKPHVSRKQTVIWFRIVYPRIPQDIRSQAVNNTASMHHICGKGRVLNTKFWLCMHVCVCDEFVND